MENNINAAIVLASLEKEAAPLIRSIKKIEVRDKDSYNLLSQKVSDLKQLYKLAETKEKSLLDPLKKLQSDIRELFSPFKTLVSGLEATAKEGMLKYIKATEVKKLKINNDLASGKIAKLSTAARKTAELEIASPSSSVRKVWVVEEIDAEVTPREYLVPDMVKIREALKAGKSVLGWKYVRRETIAI